MDEISATTAANRGSTTKTQQLYFTAAYQGIKASIVSALMWLSVIGGWL